MKDFIRSAAEIRPSPRQIAWQKMEFYAFIHFGLNTFTNQEWGLGVEDPLIFNPSELDASQWIEACKLAGMKGVILTCKHHDGFCLWPSKFTDYSVKSSPWKNGKGDLVREVADACRAAGLKFGVYLSPWDRHESSYGDSERYNRYFISQLKELLTQYGPVFSVWFDGACGEGPNGKRQAYDWDRYFSVIRELQPDAVIAVCGPDVRWCGNEAGHCRSNEWSVVPEQLLNIEQIQENSQKMDDAQFRTLVRSSDEDLGSRKVIKKTERLVWYPAEVNTSIRPGWFYHPEKDNQVKSLKALLTVYYQSVGGNSTFLLNIPPDTRGLIHDTDVARLRGLGASLRATFQSNLTEGSLVTASETFGDYFAPQQVLEPGDSSYWRPNDGTEAAELTIRFLSVQSLNMMVLMEHIASGQRVESFSLEYEDQSGWRPFFRGGVIGYKKICRFNTIRTRAIRLKIEQSRWYPTLSFIGAFYSNDICLEQN